MTSESQAGSELDDEGAPVVEIAFEVVDAGGPVIIADEDTEEKEYVDGWPVLKNITVLEGLPEISLLVFWTESTELNELGTLDIVAVAVGLDETALLVLGSWLEELEDTALPDPEVTRVGEAGDSVAAVELVELVTIELNTLEAVDVLTMVPELIVGVAEGIELVARTALDELEDTVLLVEETPLLLDCEALPVVGCTVLLLPLNTDEDKEV